ncbi:hypothetical protein GOODEAATRI_015939, partial [Goodea atripinnis]
YLHQPIDPDAPPLALQPKPSSPYQTVGCVFNHQTFLANCQPSDAVELCVFDLQDLDQATVWDDHLSYLLSSALSAYEMERCTGVSCGNEEFQDAVRRAVPDGHTFKGFPIHFLHHNARRAFATCLRSDIIPNTLGTAWSSVPVYLIHCYY